MPGSIYVFTETMNIDECNYICAMARLSRTKRVGEVGDLAAGKKGKGAAAQGSAVLRLGPSGGRYAGRH